MVDDVDQRGLEQREGLPAEAAGVPLLQCRHDPAGDTHLREPTLGGTDELRPPVGGIRLAADVAELLQLVDQLADDLLVLPGPLRQLGRPHAVLLDVGHHRAVPGMQVAEPLVGALREELVLHLEEQPPGEHAQVRLTLVPSADHPLSPHPLVTPGSRSLARAGANVPGHRGVPAARTASHRLFGPSGAANRASPKVPGMSSTAVDIGESPDTESGKSWASPFAVRPRLVLASGLMLFLELALIRWTGSNVVHLSYFSNFVLLGSFLGIGIGFLRSGRARRLPYYSPWVLAALVAFV